MKNILSHIYCHSFAYFIIAAGVLIQLYLISQPLSFLLSDILSDDAFYYFEIARNVASGVGSTFDGITHTNGYHPLWLLVLIAIYTVSAGSGLVLPIKIALLTAVCFNIITSVLLYRILGSYTKNEKVRAFLLSLWVLNPFVLYETVNGLETSLALCLLMLFIYLLKHSEVAMKNTRSLLLGLVAGFMILARVDMVFYFIAFLAWVILIKGPRAGARPFLTSGIVASIVVVPWFLWNIFGFGMLLTSAAEGTTLVNHTLARQSGVGLLYEIKHVIYHLNYYWYEVLQTTGIPMLTIFFAGVLLGMIVWKNCSFPKSIKRVPIEWSLLLGFSMLFFADAGLRFVGRTWYFISFNILVVLLFAVVLPRLYDKLPYRQIMLAGLSILVAGCFVIGWHKELDYRMSNQLAIYEAAQWIDRELPESSVVGAFNAGVLGYFLDIPVVNLDGLVNNSALEAMKQRALWDYVYEQGITHIADGEYYLTHRYGQFLGVEDPFAAMDILTKFELPVPGKEQFVSVYKLHE